MKNQIIKAKNKLSVFIAKCKPTVNRFAPDLMIFAGAVGVAVAAWKASSVTPLAKETVEEFKKEREEIENREAPEEEKREQVLDLYKKCGFSLIKLYARPVSVGVVSVTMIFLGHGKLRKEVTTLTATAASIDKMYNEYRERVIKKYGETEDFNLRTGMKEMVVEETVEKNGKATKVKKKEMVAGDIIEDSVYSRIFDETICGCKDSEYMYFFLNAQQDYANRKLQAQGYLFLNDVLDALGYKRCKEGQVVGWLYDPNNSKLHNMVDFGVRDFSKQSTRDLKNGFEHSIWLDFNVDGVIYDKLPVFADSLMNH